MEAYFFFLFFPLKGMIVILPCIFFSNDKEPMIIRLVFIYFCFEEQPNYFIMIKISFMINLSPINFGIIDGFIKKI